MGRSALSRSGRQGQLLSLQSPPPEGGAVPFGLWFWRRSAPPRASCSVLSISQSAANRPFWSSPNSSAGHHPSCGLHSPVTSEPQVPWLRAHRCFTMELRGAAPPGPVWAFRTHPLRAVAAGCTLLKSSYEGAAGLLSNELPDPQRPVTLWADVPTEGSSPAQ